MTAGSASRPRRFLAIDGGKTKTIAELTDGSSTYRSQGPGLEIITTPNGPEAVAASLRATLAPLGELGLLDSVCFGLNGVFAPRTGAQEALDVLATLLTARRMVITSDVVTTYCGALGLTPGAVVAAGTGSIAMGLGGTGEVCRVDGWGYLLGDDGSGYAIGQRGLRSALRALEGRQGSRVLASLASDRFGGSGEISRAVYGAAVPAQVVATFAPDVARAARSGDGEARQIWEDAGRELAHSVVAAARNVLEPLEQPVVSWAGGLFEAGDLLLRPFQREVRALLPQAELREPAGDALAGARLLATRPEACLPAVTLWAQTPT